MFGAVRYALSIFLLSIFFSIVSLRPESAEKNAIVPANTRANLHGNPGVEHPLKPTSIDLDRVAVEKLARKRYIVAAGGRNEPVYTKFWKFFSEAVAQTSDPGSASPKTPTTESKEPTKKADSTTPPKIPKPPAGKPTVTAPSSKAPSPTKSIPPVDQPKEEKSPPGKSPSILQMLEGHETELMIATAIAATFFLIGWICGGHYYLRRDRRRRTKIRF
jgi:hypothetical protein